MDNAGNSFDIRRCRQLRPTLSKMFRSEPAIDVDLVDEVRKLNFTSVLVALRGFNVVVPVDGMAGNNAYEDQLTGYTLTSSIVYKVTLTSIDMTNFAK